MDDFTATGPVPDILEVYDRLEEGLAALSCSVSLLKSKIQVTNGVPSEDLLLGASQRGITVVCGNVEALGAMVGLDDEEYEVFLEEELSSYDALFRAIRSPTLPAALALYYGRICVLPKPVYLMRNLPLRITLGQMGSFDTHLREAVLSRLDTPSHLPDTAIFTFHQPTGQGGMGYVETKTTTAAARWACLALGATEVQELADSGRETPLILARQK